MVIVAHAWDGQNDVIRRKAEELAGWGYVGFAAADAPAHGLRDHEAASRRAWTAARQFFKEVLQG